MPQTFFPRTSAGWVPGPWTTSARTVWASRESALRDSDLLSIEDEGRAASPQAALRRAETVIQGAG